MRLSKVRYAWTHNKLWCAQTQRTVLSHASILTEVPAFILDMTHA